MNSARLARADGRSRYSVVVEVAVDVGSVSRISDLDVTRDRNTAERLAAATGDLDLSARDVELGGTAGVRVVNGKLLDAEKVFACRNTRWNRYAVRLLEVPCS